MVEKTRIWIYWNCWTKITLHKGESIKIWKGEPTEEGFSYTEHVYEFNGTWILCYQETNSSDCDGPHDYFRHTITHFLNKSEIRDNKVIPNNWKELHHSQRDHFAESMGY